MPFPASYSDRVRKIGVVNAKNKVLTAIAATLMDGPAALRRYMIDAFVVEGFTFDEVISDDSCARQRSACGMPRALAGWAGRTIRWRLSIRKGA